MIKKVQKMTKNEEILNQLKNADNLPRHIAVIMDGNGRWAGQRGLNRVKGHREAIKSVRDVVEACAELEIDILTLYTFSMENWKRPRDEVSALMHLLVNTIRDELNDLIKNNVRLITYSKKFELCD